MAENSDTQEISISEEKKRKVVKSLRQKAQLSNLRANASLILIIVFIAAGIYIFIDAGSITIQETAPIRINIDPQSYGGVDSNKVSPNE